MSDSTAAKQLTKSSENSFPVLTIVYILVAGDRKTKQIVQRPVCAQQHYMHGLARHDDALLIPCPSAHSNLTCTALSGATTIDTSRRAWRTPAAIVSAKCRVSAAIETRKLPCSSVSLPPGLAFSTDMHAVPLRVRAPHRSYLYFVRRRGWRCTNGDAARRCSGHKLAYMRARVCRQHHPPPYIRTSRCARCAVPQTGCYRVCARCAHLLQSASAHPSNVHARAQVHDPKGRARKRRGAVRAWHRPARRCTLPTFFHPRRARRARGWYAPPTCSPARSNTHLRGRRPLTTSTLRFVGLTAAPPVASA